MSNLSWTQPHTPCNRCVRFATTVASGHATLATKQDATLYLGRTCTGWIAPALRRYGNDQTTVWRLRESHDGALDLARINRTQLLPQRRCHRLYDRVLTDPGADSDVPKDRGSRHAGRDLLEQLKPSGRRWNDLLAAKLLLLVKRYLNRQNALP